MKNKITIESKSLEKIPVNVVLPKQLQYLEKYTKPEIDADFNFSDYLRIAYDSIHEYLYTLSGMQQSKSKKWYEYVLEFILVFLKGRFGK